jgi:hypothetical protein
MRCVPLAAACCAWLMAGCQGGCGGGEGGAVGHPGTGVFVECDASGFTVRNTGDEPRYLIVDSICALNSEQIPGIGPDGRLPELVIHSSGLGVTPLTATIPAGGELRKKLDVASIGPCMDYTHAPPGQFENEPTSLVSEGPADSLRLRLHVHDVMSTDPPRTVDVACRWK